MLYQIVNRLREEKKYSYERIGYAFAQAIVSLDSRRYLGRLKDPRTRSEETGLPQQDFLGAEKNIRTKFVRGLAGKLWNGYALAEEPPSIDEIGLLITAEQRLPKQYRRGSVEEALYAGMTGKGKLSTYLTRAGKNIVSYLTDYHQRLSLQKEVNKEKGRRMKPRKEGQKKRKIAKRPNPTIKYDEIYEILRRAFSRN